VAVSLCGSRFRYWIIGYLKGKKVCRQKEFKTKESERFVQAVTKEWREWGLI